jgi:hypothetical protein
MATQVQWRGGSTAEHATFTGAAREITVDTQKQTLVVHDGSTVGGEALLREDQANLPGSVTNGIYTPGTNQVAVATNGTGRLFVDATGNVGVGTASPAQLLHVSGSGTQAIRLENTLGTGNVNLELKLTNGTFTTGLNSTSIYYDDTAGRVYAWYQNSAERMRLDTSGRLGIGTSAPSELFQVGSSTNRGAVSVVGGGATAPYIKLDYSAAAGGKTYGLISGSSGYGNFDVYDFTDSAYRLTITSSGNVGIGSTADPGAYNAKLWIDNTTDSTFTVNTTGSASLCQVVLRNSNVNGEARILNATGGPLTFYRSFGNEAARIDTSGRLLVGTSTAPSSGSYNQFGKLIVQGNTFNASSNSVLSLNRGEGAASITSGEELGVVVFGDSAGNEFGSIQCVADAAAGSGDYPGRLAFFTTADGASSPTERFRINSTGTHFAYGLNDTFYSLTNRSAGTDYATFVGLHSATSPSSSGTISFIVYSNGNVANTNNSYGAYSDIKLKENIVDANSQWNDLKALQVRKYNLKEGQTHTQIGLVAQEAELVSPGLVYETPDRDAEGNDLGTVTKSVNYSVLYMKAVKALQEAMERIEALEADVAQLKGA